MASSVATTNIRTVRSTPIRVTPLMANFLARAIHVTTTSSWSYKLSLRHPSSSLENDEPSDDQDQQGRHNCNYAKVRFCFFL